jgi:hypothetical protein
MKTMSNFFHRRNADSTIDSICTGCFQTVAVAKNESDLVRAEKSHACEPLIDRLRRYRESRATIAYRSSV